MVTLLTLVLLQTPAVPQPTPTQPAAPQVGVPQTPAPTTPRPRPHATSTATTTLAATVTDGSGAPIQGVTISTMGPVEREAKTFADGTVRLVGLRAGTYRVRFARDGFYTFEKEITWRAGQPAPEAIVTLNAAPPPPAPPPPPPAPPVEPPAPKLPPAGKPMSMQLIDYFERNQISPKEPHKENIVGCSGLGQGMLWQVSDRWEARSHASADAMFYVMAGEGKLTLGSNEISINAGSFAVVPRETKYSLMRRGRNPLVIVAFLAGAPCAAN